MQAKEDQEALVAVDVAVEEEGEGVVGGPRVTMLRRPPRLLPKSVARLICRASTCSLTSQ